MKSVLILAGLWSAQSRLFDSPVPRSKIKFLGSGVRHNHTNFHAIISAKSMEDVNDLMVTYSDCGKSVACDNSTTFLTDIQVGTQVDANPKATDTGQVDGEYKVFDVEYAYTDSTLRNHILTVFSDGLGEESIICGVGREVNQGDLNGACTPCEAGKKYKDSTKIYDAECTECTQTCADGHRVITACTADTDTVCSSDTVGGCATTNCGNGQYVSVACDIGSASQASTTPGECASCKDCNSLHNSTDTPCVPGSSTIPGSDAQCSYDCVTGFIQSGDNCVSESFMFGWVYRADTEGVCKAKCVKWTGTLNDNFIDSVDRGFKTPSAQICALLSQREPLLRSSDCGRT